MKKFYQLDRGENGKDKCSLYTRLEIAIEEKDSGTAKGILTNGDENLQEVLGTWILVQNTVSTADYFTFLTYAITLGNTDVAEAILDIEDQNTLKTLLEEMSTLKFLTYIRKLTALSLAEQMGFTVLAKKIKAKMDELGIPDKEDELIKGENHYEYTLSHELYMDVLRRDGEAANDTLEYVRANLSGLSDKKAQELAEKENTEIIKKIQTEQAVKIAIIGFVVVALAVSAIAAIVLSPKAALIIGEVTFGAMGAGGGVGIGVAIFHGFKEIPYTKVEEIGADKLAQAKAANGGAKET